jgi:hypothetical protein
VRLSRYREPANLGDLSMRSAATLPALFLLAAGLVWSTAAVADDQAERLQRAEAQLARLAAAIDAGEERLQRLEASIARALTTAEAAKAAIAAELAQPMLLLVGMGPCPAGFKRIETRVLILTRARNAENGHLFDMAGLPYEDPPGVGDNVYRDLDFCFRPANSVKLD